MAETAERSEFSVVIEVPMTPEQKEALADALQAHVLDYLAKMDLSANLRAVPLNKESLGTPDDGNGEIMGFIARARV